MATLSDYKGLDVVEDATGDGGIALTENFKELADRAPYQANANPGASDDSTKGFSPGDTWLNTTTQVLWACVTNGTGAAVWKSVLKRTGTGLQLIPQESTEEVQVCGNGKVDGKLGVGRAASTCPLEVQQGTGDTVLGCRVVNSAGTQGAELGVTAAGTVLLRRANNNTPVVVVNTYFRLQGGERRYRRREHSADCAAGYRK